MMMELFAKNNLKFSIILLRQLNCSTLSQRFNASSSTSSSSPPQSSSSSSSSTSSSSSSSSVPPPKIPNKPLPTQQYTGKRRFRLPVEEDSYKLVNYCCGANYYDKDSEPIKIKDDSEYPDWIWKLRLGPKPLAKDLDQNTKEYWEALAEEGITRQKRLFRTFGRRQMIVGETLRKKYEMKERRKYRVLARYHFDAGLEQVHDFGDGREDYWNFEKDRLRLPEQTDQPYLTGVDQIPNMPNYVERKLRWRTLVPKIGRWGL